MLNNDRGRNPIRSGENYEKNRSKHEAKLNRSERDAMCISFQSPREIPETGSGGTGFGCSLVQTRLAAIGHIAVDDSSFRRFIERGNQRAVILRSGCVFSPFRQ